jgi:hypothetical protein
MVENERTDHECIDENAEQAELDDLLTLIGQDHSMTSMSPLIDRRFIV